MPWRRLVFLGIATLSLALPAGTSFAAPEPRKNFPCSECLFYPPIDPAKPTPLLVVLHGDAPGGTKPLVERDASPFVKEATARGIAIFAPRCPKDQGCKVGSFWQWTENDPPGWINKQIEIIRKDFALDAQRVWIAGWSGGASFLGAHYSEMADRFSALIFAGGGMNASSFTCPSCPPPTYFMVGDKNPLHHLAKDLRKGVTACKSHVTWDLLPGQDHGGEWRTLNRPEKIKEIFDWLTSEETFDRRPCRIQTAALAAPPVTPSIVVPTPSVTPSAAPPVEKIFVPAPSSCSLSNSSHDSHRKAPFGVVMSAFFLLIRRRRHVTRAIDAKNQMEMVPKKAS